MDYLLCPECWAAPLEAAGDLLSCDRCHRLYPALGGIPLLMSKAELRLEQWSASLHAFLSETEVAERQLLAQSVQHGLNARTRARLTATAQGLRNHASRVQELFERAGLTAAKESTPDPPTESILAYYTLVHRDWGWAPEVDEVTPAIDALVAVLPSSFVLGRTLVLGAGTARLAWELGNRLNAGVDRANSPDILALDVNPLPFLVTKRLMGGETVPLFELPGHPRRSTFACTERQLKAESAAPRGLKLVFADGLNPPVRDASFDTVITPWFVDQVPEDLATLPAVIRRVLRPGGAWLNQGPFVYDPARTKPAHRYCADEFVYIVNTSGFSISKATYTSFAHLASPVSAQGRTEWVLTMHATATQSPESANEPPWLLASGADDVIPLWDGLSSYVAPHPSIEKVARLVDGTRSARSIAQNLVADDELSAGDALEAVQGCLRVIWHASGER